MEWNRDQWTGATSSCVNYRKLSGCILMILSSSWTFSRLDYRHCPKSTSLIQSSILSCHRMIDFSQVCQPVFLQFVYLSLWYLVILDLIDRFTKLISCQLCLCAYYSNYQAPYLRYTSFLLDSPTILKLWNCYYRVLQFSFVNSTERHFWQQVSYVSPWLTAWWREVWIWLVHPGVSSTYPRDIDEPKLASFTFLPYP